MPGGTINPHPLRVQEASEVVWCHVQRGKSAGGTFAKMLPEEGPNSLTCKVISMVCSYADIWAANKAAQMCFPSCLGH